MAFDNRPKDFFAKQIRSSHLIASGGIIDPESSDWDEQLPHLRLMIYPRDTLEVDTSTGATEYIDGAFEGIIPPTLLNDVKYNDDGQISGGTGLKVGHDVWLFISGAQGTTHIDHNGDGEVELSEMERRSDHGVVLFGGDVVVSGTLFAERQVVEVDLSHEGQLFVSGNLRAQDYTRDHNFVQFRSPGYREDIQYPDLWLSGEAAMLTHKGSHSNPKMWQTGAGILTAEEAGYTGFYLLSDMTDVTSGAADEDGDGVVDDDTTHGSWTEEEWAAERTYTNPEIDLTSIPDADGTGTDVSVYFNDNLIATDTTPYYTVEQLNAAIVSVGNTPFANRDDAIEAGSGFLAFNPGDTLANSNVIFNVDSIEERIGINVDLPMSVLDVRRRKEQNDNQASELATDGSWSDHGKEQVTFLLHGNDSIGHGGPHGTSNPLNQNINNHDDISFYVWGVPGAKDNFTNSVWPNKEQRKSVAGFGGDVVISGTLYTEGGELVLTSFHDTIDGDETVDSSTNAPLGTITFKAAETGSDYAEGTAAKIQVEAAGEWISGGDTPARLNFYTDDDSNPALTLANDGDIGIGTEDPDAQLEIVQSPSSDIGLKISYEKTDGTPATTYTDLRVNADGHLDITPEGNTARVTSDGNTIFQVQSSATDGNVSINFDTTGDGSPEWSIGVDDGDSDKLKIDVGGIAEDTAVTILTNKNVGIGTGTPESKLDVEGNVSIGANYAGTTAGPVDGAIIEGSVGIGTNTPDAKLEIEDDLEQLRLTHTQGTYETKFHVNETEFKIQNIGGDIVLDPSTGIAQVLTSDGTGGIVRQDQVRAYDTDGLLISDQDDSGIKVYDGGTTVVGDVSWLSISDINAGAHPAQLNVTGKYPDGAHLYPHIFWPLISEPAGVSDGSWDDSETGSYHGFDGDAARHPLRLVGLKEDNTNYHPETGGEDACIKPKVLVVGLQGDVMYTESVLGRLGQDRDSRYSEGDNSKGETWPDGSLQGDDAAGVPGNPYDNGYITPDYGGPDGTLIKGWDGDTSVGHAIDDLNHGLREVSENNPWDWQDIDTIAGGDVVTLKDTSNQVGIGTLAPDSKVHMARLDGHDIDIKIEGSQFENQTFSNNPASSNPQAIAKLQFAFDSEYWLSASLNYSDTSPEYREAIEAAMPALEIIAETRLGYEADKVVDVHIQSHRKGSNIELNTSHDETITVDGYNYDDAGSMSPFKVRGSHYRGDMQVLVLSGTTTLSDPNAPNPKYFSDVNFFVSGSTGSAATAAAPLGSGIRGTACFGGDVVVSGTLYANIVPLNAPNQPHVIYSAQEKITTTYTVNGTEGTATLNDPENPSAGYSDYPSYPVGNSTGTNLHPFSGLGLGDDPGPTTPGWASALAAAGLSANFRGAGEYKNTLQVSINGQLVTPGEYILDGSDPQSIKLKPSLSTGDVIMVDRYQDPNSWGAIAGTHMGDLLDTRVDTPAGVSIQVGPTSDDVIQIGYTGAIGTDGNGIPVNVDASLLYNEPLVVEWINGPASHPDYGLTIKYTIDNTDGLNPTIQDIVDAINNGTFLDENGIELPNILHAYAPWNPTVWADGGSGSYTFGNGINTPASNSILRWNNLAGMWYPSTDSGGSTISQPVIVKDDGGNVIESNAGYLQFEGDITVTPGGPVGGIPGAVISVTAAPPPQNLNDLDDVNAPSPQNGQTLNYNEGTFATARIQDPLDPWKEFTISAFTQGSWANGIQLQFVHDPDPLHINYDSAYNTITFRGDWSDGSITPNDISAAIASDPSVNSIIMVTYNPQPDVGFNNIPNSTLLGNEMPGTDSEWFATHSPVPHVSSENFMGMLDDDIPGTRLKSISATRSTAEIPGFMMFWSWVEGDVSGAESVPLTISVTQNPAATAISWVYDQATRVLTIEANWGQPYASYAGWQNSFYESGMEPYISYMLHTTQIQNYGTSNTIPTDIVGTYTFSPGYNEGFYSVAENNTVSDIDDVHNIENVSDGDMLQFKSGNFAQTIINLPGGSELIIDCLNSGPPTLHPGLPTGSAIPEGAVPHLIIFDYLYHCIDPSTNDTLPVGSQGECDAEGGNWEWMFKNRCYFPDGSYDYMDEPTCTAGGGLHGPIVVRWTNVPYGNKHFGIIIIQADWEAGDVTCQDIIDAIDVVQPGLSSAISISYDDTVPDNNNPITVDQNIMINVDSTGLQKDGWYPYDIESEIKEKAIERSSTVRSVVVNHGETLDIATLYDSDNVRWPNIIPVQVDDQSISADAHTKIILPAAADSNLINSQTFIVKDELGTAQLLSAENKIQILPAAGSGDSIDEYNDTDNILTLESNHASITLYTNGSNRWHII